MTKLRKRWGYVRCKACSALTQAKHTHCEHCKFKIKEPTEKKK